VELLTAAQIVLANNRGVRFIIIGEGEQRQHLEGLAQLLGIQDQVTFTGPRSDIAELLPALDLFVSSSHWEAFPTVLLESMAAGVPIAATRTTGAQIMLKEGENGWLVPLQNSTALAQAIQAAIDHPNLRQAFAEKASHAVQAYSIQTIADRYASLYQKICRMPGQSRAN
jgi:glycosyltransferase involved in cell wall biosynthesis